MLICLTYSKFSFRITRTTSTTFVFSKHVVYFLSRFYDSQFRNSKPNSRHKILPKGRKCWVINLKVANKVTDRLFLGSINFLTIVFDSSRKANDIFSEASTNIERWGNAFCMDICDSRMNGLCRLWLRKIIISLSWV